MSTNIQLDIFEGPLDLLLHLIKKNEVSITDIPIAAITEQFLATLELMESLNLDVAGEFLVIAATLIHIKSRMLLPLSAGEDEEEEEGADPRDELVRRLLEYQRFKEAANELAQRDVLTRDVFVRAATPPEAPDPPVFRELSIFELLTALRRVLERLPKDMVHEVILERITVREKMTFLLERLRVQGQLVFESLFSDACTRMEVIVTFLAMLELVKMRAIRMFQQAAQGPIMIDAAVALEQAAEFVAQQAQLEEERHGE
jgi:segregation and condensation protein A